MKRLSDLYLAIRGEQPISIDKLTTGAGSNRVYYRLKGADGWSAIGVVGTSKEENHAFIYLSHHFTEKHLSVPKVYTVSEDGECYLQQDLGNRTLYDALVHGRERGEYDETEVELLTRTIRCLPKLQFRGAEGLDYTHCYPKEEFDKESMFFDLNYFKYCFLKTSGIDFNEVKLEEAFHLLANNLTRETFTGFMYRDFQARNVMLSNDNEPYFIDFQGGRRGPCYYDIASFLWQASAGYGAQLREQLVEIYYEELTSYTTVPPMGEFRERLQVFVLFRILQVLGAYGYRGYFERKPYFIKSIIPAIQNLRELLQTDDFGSTYLINVLRQLVALPQYNTNRTTEKQQALVVRVVSFSYKYGIPTDESGHGGGYVFDCRGTNNPGRYPQFNEMTGIDEPVIRFIEEDGELITFLDNVYKLADAHVKRYLERGFTNIMFAFGCTGGRHRSVYAAEHLATHIHQKYGVEVIICHREQNISKVLR